MVFRHVYLPNRVIACRRDADFESGSPHLDPIFIGKHTEPQTPAVFMCEKFACQAPVVGKKAVLNLWDSLSVS